jgi:alkaline phosphatase
MNRSETRAAAALAAVALAALVAGGCAHVPLPAAGSSPKNIIFMIGDGMGLAQVTGALVTDGGLEMERLPVGGFIKTFAEDRLVTDSAASGTALATGRKTCNGRVSVSCSGEPYTTVLEYAEARGMATGLVVTCSITHATPAVFASHVVSREQCNEIARQMAASGADVLFGGGRSFFLPRGEPGSTRTDDADPLAVLRDRMPVALSAEEFRALGDVEAAAALLAPEHPPAREGRDPSLRELTERALEILSKDPDGFFVMIEGSQIDWAGHQNSPAWLMTEIDDFDRAVGVAMDFAEKDGRTLVVVTADHETGGYAILDGSLDRREVSAPRFGTGDHTASMVPLLAFGPGSEVLGGIQDNTDLGRTLIAYVNGRR